MEMLQLRYFYESAKTENFAKTANKFMVPATSVSIAVKRLESELDVKLFDRSANRISLNSNGKILKNALSIAFREIDGAVEEISAHKSDPREIKILVCGMRRKITEFITEYNAKYSHVGFKTVFNNDKTEFKDYDIIVDEEKSEYSEYDKIELFDMNLRLKCAANDPLCNQKLTLMQLRDRPFALMDSKGNMNKILVNACQKIGFTPKIAVLCNDIECYETFIASGMGIGIGRQGDTLTSNKGIVDLNVADFNERYKIFAYYSQKEYYGKLKSFVDFLKSKSI